MAFVKNKQAAPELPSFSNARHVAEFANDLAQMSVGKEPVDPRTAGGVSHDAAAITAAMSAMKTEDEVKVLFTNIYNHILKTVLES